MTTLTPPNKSRNAYTRLNSYYRKNILSGKFSSLTFRPSVTHPGCTEVWSHENGWNNVSIILLPVPVHVAYRMLASIKGDKPGMLYIPQHITTDEIIQEIERLTRWVLSFAGKDNIAPNLRHAEFCHNDIVMLFTADEYYRDPLTDCVYGCHHRTATENLCS